MGLRDPDFDELVGEEGKLSALTVITGTAALSSSGSSFNKASIRGDRESAGRVLILV